MTLRSELVVFVVWFGTALASGIASAAIAERRSRSASLFLLIGFVLPVVGVLIALRVPRKAQQAQSLPAQLAELKRQHAAGTLSDEEWEAARAALLDG